VGGAVTQDRILESLQETFDYYFENVVDQAAAATVLNNGKRPECLANEVYSAFHHIAST
jgi:hypothetical protein